MCIISEIRLDVLKQIAHALAVQFGSDCEILIHDLEENKIGSSIVYIENGHISGRQIGGGPSQIVLDTIKHAGNDLQDKLSYLTKTDTGRLLKSSTIFIKNDDGKPRYIISINYDITNLIATDKALKALITCDGEEEGEVTAKHIANDVNGLLDDLIEQSVELVGVPAPLMNKEDKIKAINYLNDAGAFLITKSGDKVSKYFGISKYTLYSYVDINK